MIAEGQVSPHSVTYNDLPWKYAAGTPNILGVIVSAQALRLLVDLVSPPGSLPYFGSARPLHHYVVAQTMENIGRHTRDLTARALQALTAIDGLSVYGPTSAAERTPLISFNVAGMSPFTISDGLDRLGIESRAGCHCATLAHRSLGLDPPASCRLSFAVYNTVDDIDRATDALARVVSGRLGTVASNR
jgi:cysteine desulfurase/selenocysteine lyase